MSKDLLLEIGLEEIPARFIPGASSQLVEKITHFLQQKRIGYGEVKAYSTPRRLAVFISQVDEEQQDINENAKGPAKRIAMDEGGNWTKAALGFARGQGANPEDLFLDEFKGEEYVFVRKYQKGLPTVELLHEIASTITSMHFPKHMRWGAEELRFVRPIRWLVFLFGDEVVPITIAGVESGRITRGHRFLGGEVTLSAPKDYLPSLAKEFCLVDPEERRQRIVKQIEIIASEQGWTIPLDEGLLEEVTHLVEYPTSLYGSFDKSFLEIPREVLVTSMRENQRYFPVEDQEGNLLPYFITVRNGDAQNLEGVAKGNEKVLSARLADARFFYEEDQKMPIAEALNRLEQVVFHEDLGTIADKVRRIRELSGEWAEMLKLEEEIVEQIDRTSSICKFDLVTQMVYEFPELQGVMGEDYATRAGENPAVARGVFEHYLPRFSGDILPTSDVGALVSIADKMDTIVGIFSLGMIPTGSQDPYALRRQAQGIINILFERDYDFTLEQLFHSSIKAYAQRQLLKGDEGELLHELEQFFLLRLKNLLSERGIRYDVVDAVLGAPLGRITDLVAKAEVLHCELERSELKTTVEAFTRVNNLAAKGESEEIDETRFVEEAEVTLYKKALEIEKEIQTAMKERNLEQTLTEMAKLVPFIETYFDSVMVMVEDEELRRTRLALLKKLSRMFSQFADFNKIVFL